MRRSDRKRSSHPSLWFPITWLYELFSYLLFSMGWIRKVDVSFISNYFKLLWIEIKSSWSVFLASWINAFEILTYAVMFPRNSLLGNHGSSPVLAIELPLCYYMMSRSPYADHRLKTLKNGSVLSSFIKGCVWLCLLGLWGFCGSTTILPAKKLWSVMCTWGIFFPHVFLNSMWKVWN